MGGESRFVVSFTIEIGFSLYLSLACLHASFGHQVSFSSALPYDHVPCGGLARGEGGGGGGEGAAAATALGSTTTAPTSSSFFSTRPPPFPAAAAPAIAIVTVAVASAASDGEGSTTAIVDPAPVPSSRGDIRETLSTLDFVRAKKKKNVDLVVDRRFSFPSCTPLSLASRLSLA